MFKISEEGLVYVTDDKRLKSKTLKEAIRKAILKWSFIAANAEKVADEGGMNTCALCTYSTNKKNIVCCSRCPVMKATGKARCMDTPYSIFYHIDLSDTKGRKIAAQSEVAFMQALLKAEK